VLSVAELIFIGVFGCFPPLIVSILVIIYENNRRKAEIGILMDYVEDQKKDLDKWAKNLPKEISESIRNGINRSAGNAGSEVGSVALKGSNWLSRLAGKATETATVRKISDGLGLPKEVRGPLGAFIGEAVDAFRGGGRQKKTDQLEDPYAKL
jgi:uncharacterized BrkB/YihY/UPF0761 family membrane protein